MKPGQRKTRYVVYYYLDYKSFVDLVKFKIYKIDHQLKMDAQAQEIHGDIYNCSA